MRLPLDQVWPLSQSDGGTSRPCSLALWLCGHFKMKNYFFAKPTNFFAELFLIFSWRNYAYFFYWAKPHSGYNGSVVRWSEVEWGGLMSATRNSSSCSLADFSWRRGEVRMQPVKCRRTGWSWLVVSGVASLRDHHYQTVHLNTGPGLAGHHS